MTWHRIDEYASIDDTLVTCAEYQLYIDEMRGRKKYCQPDHWTSHQFPKGQAHEPVFGVRHSDALEFCTWLTKQEKRERFYRLPTNTETTEYPFTINKISSPIGYWLTSADDLNRFAWVEPAPSNLQGVILAYSVDLTRPIDIEYVRKLNISRPDSTDHAHTVAKELIQAYNQNLPRVRFIALRITDILNNAINLDNNEHPRLVHTCKIANTLVDAITGIINYDHSIDLAFLRARNDIDLGFASARKLNRDLVINRRRVQRIVGELVRYFERNREIGIAFDRGLALSLDKDIIHFLDRNIDRVRDFDKTREVALTRACNQAREFFPDLYPIFFTLQERIAERSPAFEGIRLVKERMR
jgi:hypothetical protein